MFELELTGGIKLRMPENLGEITVSQYCEFLQGVNEFIRWQNERLEAEEEVFSTKYQLERLHRISAMVQAFCLDDPDGGITLEQLFAMPVGDYAKSLKESFGIDRLEDLDLDRSEATLYNLWANITKVVADTDLVTVGDSVTFEWKGEKYTIKPMNRDRMTGAELPPDLSVQEAVEVLELRRKAAVMLEAGKHEAKNIKWELFHRQLAILALKEGEELPEDDLAFERFVSERAAHFIGIDAESALKVDFFLAGPFGLLRDTVTLISFSTLQDPKTSRTRRRGAKSSPKIKRSARELGTGGFTKD